MAADDMESGIRVRHNNRAHGKGEKMKRIALFVLAVTAGAVMFLGTGFAKEVSGKVAAVDTAGSKLTISIADASGAASQKDIWVKSDASFAGVAALNELKAGDQVSVEAEEEAGTGNWKASKVSKA